ncbi:MAG: 50S ribosomal protein L30 [Solirubrobacterales bacterium]
MAEVVLITQLRSANGSDRAQRETLRTLGLRGIGSSSRRADGPAIRGMLRKVSHLVTVEQGTDDSARSDA